MGFHRREGVIDGGMQQKYQDDFCFKRYCDYQRTAMCSNCL